MSETLLAYYRSSQSFIYVMSVTLDSYRREVHELRGTPHFWRIGFPLEYTLARTT